MNFTIYEVIWSYYDHSVRGDVRKKFIVTASSSDAACLAVYAANSEHPGAGYILSFKELGPA